MFDSTYMKKVNQSINKQLRALSQEFKLERRGLLALIQELEYVAEKSKNRICRDLSIPEDLLNQLEGTDDFKRICFESVLGWAPYMLLSPPSER